MPLFKKKTSSDEKFLLRGEKELVDPLDLLYRLLDQLYDSAEKVVAYILLVEDQDYRRVKLPEEVKHSLNNLKKLIDLILSRCG